MTDSSLFEPSPIKQVPKPWGYELIWAISERYVGKLLHIKAGESLSLQYHEVKDETLYLTSGEILLTLRSGDDQRVRTMRVGEAFHIPPRLIHRIEAVIDSDLMEVSTTELDDVVRLEDRYGRQGTNEA